MTQFTPQVKAEKWLKQPTMTGAVSGTPSDCRTLFMRAILRALSIGGL